MKKIYGFLGALALLTLASCSNDEPATGNLDQNAGDMFMTLKVTQASTGGRTTTPDQGIEPGKDYETTIDNLAVVFTLENSTTPVGVKLVNASELTNSGNYYTASFNLDRGTFAAAQNEAKNYNVYVVANYTSEIAADLNAHKDLKEITFTNSDTENKFWQNGKFLMSNAAMETIPVTPDDVKKGAHSKKEDALSLGSVKVQRAMSRFDLYKETTTKVNNISKEKSPYSVDVQINGIALVNEAKSAYLFKRVGDTEDAATLFAAESATNYVFAPKQTAFYYPMYSNLNVSNLETVTGDFNGFGSFTYTTMDQISVEDETFTHPGSTQAEQKDYRIWRYCMPNNIFDKANQKWGISTGIIFRAEMTFKKSTEDASETLKNKTIYAFGNKVFGTLEELGTYATENPADEESILFSAIESPDKAKLVAAGFTAYQTDDSGKTECYYLYWNRHNDNLDNYIMGEMEFATVRNNIYKLSVENIYNLGYAKNTEDNPHDPFDPNNPDEKDEFWGQISVEILKWEVRMNNIEF